MSRMRSAAAASRRGSSRSGRRPSWARCSFIAATTDALVKLRAQHDKHAAITALIDYDAFCNPAHKKGQATTPAPFLLDDRELVAGGLVFLGLRLLVLRGTARCSKRAVIVAVRWDHGDEQPGARGATSAVGHERQGGAGAAEG